MCPAVQGLSCYIDCLLTALEGLQCLQNEGLGNGTPKQRILILLRGRPDIMRVAVSIMQYAKKSKLLSSTRQGLGLNQEACCSTRRQMEHLSRVIDHGPSLCLQGVHCSMAKWCKLLRRHKGWISTCSLAGQHGVVQHATRQQHPRDPRPSHPPPSGRVNGIGGVLGK